MGEELGVYLPAVPCDGSLEAPGDVGGAGTASEKIAFMVLITRIPILEQQTSKLTSYVALHWLRDPLCLSGPQFPIAQKGEHSPLVLPG